MPCQKRNSSQRAFTLVEVMVAMTVLILVFVSSVSAITIGFRVVEDTRMNTLASQVLQSEVETLRLKNWSEISALPASASFTIDSTLNAAAFDRFTCQRVVTDENADLKQIVLTVSWNAINGQPRVRRYVTYIARGGLNDYFYRRT